MGNFIVKLVKRLVRVLAIVVVIGLCVPVAWTLGAVLAAVPVQTQYLPLPVGFAVGVLLFSVFSRIRFLSVYVFGHELTHWLAAKLCRRRTGRLKLGCTRGSVEIDDPNLVIVLAPYVVPFYTMIWIGVYGVVRFFLGQHVPPLVETIAHGGIGLTYAYHLVLTLKALSPSQTDLMYHGFIFSLLIVLLGNLVLLLAGSVVATGQWTYAATTFYQKLKHEGVWIVQACEVAAAYLQSLYRLMNGHLTQ